MFAKTKHMNLWKPNKGNNNGTVLQGAFKRESPQKPTKPIRSSTISTNVTTEKQMELKKQQQNRTYSEPPPFRRSSGKMNVCKN
jgi:hypothetical protein